MNNSGLAEEKWYEKYLPFVAKSPKMQAEWLACQLSRLGVSQGKEKGGILSSDEIKPYIRLLLENSDTGSGCPGEGGGDCLVALLGSMGEENLLLMLECAEVYDVPRLFNLIQHPTLKMAVIAIKKVPPPYEKNPLLIIDRVFFAIREKSGKLLDESAVAVMAGSDAPTDFSDNFARFREIMMDEHILSLLYPKAK